MSLTITLCCHDKSWLIAKSPLPPLVGATISVLPISRRFCVGRTTTYRLKNNHSFLIPKSTPSGHGAFCTSSASSCRLANLARCNATAPIVPPPCPVLAALAQDHARVSVLKPLLWLLVALP